MSTWLAQATCPEPQTLTSGPGPYGPAPARWSRCRHPRGLPTVLADATRACPSILVAHVMLEQFATSQVGLCSEPYRCRKRVLPHIASLEPESYVPLLSSDHRYNYRPESPPPALVPAAWLFMFVTILFYAFSHIPNWERASTLVYIFIFPI